MADTAALAGRQTHELRRTDADRLLAERQLLCLSDNAESRRVTLRSDERICEAESMGTAWRRPELFELDDAHRATMVGGAPPEPAFPAGQSWGMPAYRTSERAALLEHFATRLDHEARRVGPGGIVRLDHLLGAAEPYYVPV